MPHHEKVALAGVIEHVFAHRFTLLSHGEVYLATWGPRVPTPLRSRRAFRSGSRANAAPRRSRSSALPRRTARGSRSSTRNRTTVPGTPTPTCRQRQASSWPPRRRRAGDPRRTRAQTQALRAGCPPRPRGVDGTPRRFFRRHLQGKARRRGEVEPARLERGEAARPGRVRCARGAPATGAPDLPSPPQVRDLTSPSPVTAESADTACVVWIAVNRMSTA